VAKVESQPASKDEGVILVFWVLCLSLLVTLLVGVIALGNLLQSGDNAQNAADAAVLAGEDVLVQQGSHYPGLFTDSVQIPRSADCQVDLSNCGSLTWLSGYYVYQHGDWLQIVTSSTLSATQISATSALQYGIAYGRWTCSDRTRTSRRHPGPPVCIQLTSGAPWHSSSVEGSLTYDTTISAAVMATNTATSILRQYGFSSYSGCAAPTGFAVTAGTMGISCIGYDAGGTLWVSVPDSSLFPIGGITKIEKTSWADLLPNGTTSLCSPGNCD
jgi:Putative Flp pilus-assembly TadE/G-like